jgi:hypothetical protein
MASRIGIMGFAEDSIEELTNEVGDWLRTMNSKYICFEITSYQYSTVVVQATAVTKPYIVYSVLLFYSETN